MSADTAPAPASALGVAPNAGFHVDYEIKEVNADMGNGIFAKQDIPIGTLIWKFTRDSRVDPANSGEAAEGNVRCYSSYEETKARLQELSPEEQKFFMEHVYLYLACANEILDDGKYWNHSESPNTGCGLDVNSTYAIRDIKAGEELLDDYGTYEYPDWFITLAKEYKVPQDFITIKARPGFQMAYELKETPERGVGIFAKEFIPANQLIWKFQIGSNIRLFKGEEECRAHLEILSKENGIDWLTHVYLFDGYINEILDDGKMWNHSEEPNTCSGINDDWDSTYAARDIEIGEELLDDYGTYEYPEWFFGLCAEYGVPQDYFVIKK
jgi:hypothetical protein